MVANGSFPATACEAVAVFDREDDVQIAIDRFQRFGFDRSVLSVLSHMELVEKLRELRRECRDCFPRFQSNGAENLTDMESAGIAQGALIAGPLYLFACCAMFGVASNGAALATIAMAGIIGGAVGGALGAVLAARFMRRRRRTVAIRNNRGNLFLWVRIQDREHENRAREILARYPARDVHLHGARPLAAAGS